MTQQERIFKYVPHRNVPAFMAAGWIHRDELRETHHGDYSELMEWSGNGEPFFPVEDEVTG